MNKRKHFLECCHSLLPYLACGVGRLEPGDIGVFSSPRRAHLWEGKTQRQRVSLSKIHQHVNYFRQCQTHDNSTPSTVYLQK